MTQESLRPIAELPNLKVEEYGRPGNKPQLKWIEVANLRIDPRYQRNIGWRGIGLIRKILEEFSWDKFQPLIVAPIGNGFYAVADGQHRAVAAAHHPEIEDVPCLLIDAEDLVAQAKSFRSINKDRTNVTPSQLYFAGLAAKDPDCLHLQSVCEAADISIEKTPRLGGCAPKETRAVRTLSKLLKQHGDAPVIWALRAIVSAFPEERDQLRSQVIKGLVLFHLTYTKHSAFDEERLAERLQDVDLKEAVEAARDAKRHFGGTTDINFVRAIVRAYNKGLKTNALPDIENIN